VAATVTVQRDIQLAEGGGEHLLLGTIVPGTYATGGVAVDPAKNELVEFVFTGASSGYVSAWDSVNQKLLVYRQKDPGAAGGADIALVEVANAVDLSGVTFKFAGFGF
jgi:hypothetical protein